MNMQQINDGYGHSDASGLLATICGYGTVTCRGINAGNGAPFDPEVYMKMTAERARGATAVFPLGEITATDRVLRRIPRLELFAALRTHSAGQAVGENSSFPIGEMNQSIQTAHRSSTGEDFFVKTWVTNPHTLIWVIEDEE